MRYKYAIIMSMVFSCSTYVEGQPFTPRAQQSTHTFSDIDYLRAIAHSAYWGFGLGAMYGYNQCNEQPCDYEILYAPTGTILALIGTLACMKLYSKIASYYRG